MNMKKTALFGILALVVIGCVLAAGCVSEDTDSATGPKWLHSDIIGVVTPETDVSLVDDYHAAVNKEWLSTTEIPEGSVQTSPFSEADLKIQEKFFELMNDPSVTGHEADMVRAYYNAYMDWDQRNKDGLAPLEKYTKPLEQIQTIEDYNGFISENGDFACLPLCSTDVFNPSRYALYLNPPLLSLGDPAEYTSLTSTGKLTKEANAVFFKKMLLRLGYTEEQADTMEEDRMWLESQLASVMKTNEEKTNSVAYYGGSARCSLEDLKALAPDYPVEQLLAGYTENGVNEVIVTEPEVLKKLNELYTPENLEKFKAYSIYMYINSYAQYLDEETQELLDERTSSQYGMNYTSNPEKEAFSSITTVLLGPADKFYAENALEPETKEDVISMTRSLIDIYRERLADATWLTEETRAKAIEKLDAIRIFALYPDDWSDYDYSAVSFENCTTLLDIITTWSKFKEEKNFSLPGTQVDTNKWYDSGTSLTANAEYNPLTNAINIYAGVITDPFYDPSATIEKNLGGLGYAIGHEISHAFDSTGSQFDKDGNLNNWWTDEDRKAFEEKTKKVADYFSTIEAAPDTYVNGTMTLKETVADLGGMSVILEAASRIDGFDYDTFFRSNAGIWRVLMTEERAKYKLATDVHPLGSVRTNATLQQFEEFYTTYDVKPGDGMYLAPENRLSVW